MIWLTCFMVWLLASLPFLYVLERIIRHGSHDVDHD